jgi:hypothetical protein
MSAPDPLAVAIESFAAFVAHRVADELRALLVAAHAPSSAAPLLTLEALAHTESCSRATIRRLVCEGAPCSYLGQSPRFDLLAWRAWCAERGRQGTKAKATKRAAIAGVRLLSRGQK